MEFLQRYWWALLGGVVRLAVLVRRFLGARGWRL